MRFKTFKFLFSDCGPAHASRAASIRWTASPTSVRSAKTSSADTREDSKMEPKNLIKIVKKYYFWTPGLRFKLLKLYITTDNTDLVLFCFALFCVDEKMESQFWIFYLKKFSIFCLNKFHIHNFCQKHDIFAQDINWSKNQIRTKISK